MQPYQYMHMVIHLLSILHRRNCTVMLLACIQRNRQILGAHHLLRAPYHNVSPSPSGRSKEKKSLPTLSLLHTRRESFALGLAAETPLIACSQQKNAGLWRRGQVYWWRARELHCVTR